MALVGSDSNAVILSEYTSSLNVSNRRRYLEKISGIGDPYCISIKRNLVEKLYHLSQVLISSD